VNDTQKRRPKKPVHNEPNKLEDQNVTSDLDNNISPPIIPSDLHENTEHHNNKPLSKVKRRVSFADKVNIIIDDQQIDDDDQSNENSRLPLARDTLIDKMDSKLRMLIIKELSKDSHIERPLSKMSELPILLFPLSCILILK
jgi:hypothetical protein